MSIDKATDFKKFETDELYGLELFTERKPKSRLIRNINKQLAESSKEWSTDSHGVLVDFIDFQRRDNSYYLITESPAWTKKLEPEPGGMELSKVLDWWEDLLTALTETEPWNKDWHILTIENLRLDQNDNIKLIPKPFEEIITKYNLKERFIDTNSYRPPEDINNESDSKNEKAMVFSLGVIIYLLVTGENPFGGRDQTDTLDRILGGRRLSPAIIRSELSEELSSLINSCLKPDSDKRPDMAFLLEEINRIKLNNIVENNIKEAKIKNNQKKQQRFQLKQSIIYNFKQRWQVLALISILVVGFFAMFFTAGTDDIVTSAHQPHEVVEYFYQAIDEKNVTMLDDTNSIDLGQLRRMVTETHVLETVRQFYEMQAPTEESEIENGEDVEISIDEDADLEVEPELEAPEEMVEDELPSVEEELDIPDNEEDSAIFGVNSLEINYLQENDEIIIEANYIFFINSENGRVDWQAKDYLRLNRINDRWQITGIRGFLEDIIRGEFQGI